MSVITGGGVQSSGNITVNDGSADVCKQAATGQINGIERTAVAGATGWDLSTGNNWTAGAIAIPQPINGVAGQSGTLIVTAPPVSWPANGALKYPEGTAPILAAYPAVIPFYVQNSTNVLLGYPTEGIA